MKISQLFNISVAKSSGVEDYDFGKIPFITSTTLNNGVARYVDPFNEDKVFEGPAICISGLGYATVQNGKFLPKGNGGDSVTILLPRNKMSHEELLYYAALFNLIHTWRFSFGRKASKYRLKDLELLPEFKEFNKEIKFELEDVGREMLDRFSDLIQKEK